MLFIYTKEEFKQIAPVHDKAIKLIEKDRRKTKEKVNAFAKKANEVNKQIEITKKKRFDLEETAKTAAMHDVLTGEEKKRLQLEQKAMLEEEKKLMREYGDLLKKSIDAMEVSNKNTETLLQDLKTIVMKLNQAHIDAIPPEQVLEVAKEQTRNAFLLLIYYTSTREESGLHSIITGENYNILMPFQYVVWNINYDGIINGMKKSPETYLTLLHNGDPTELKKPKEQRKYIGDIPARLFIGEILKGINLTDEQEKERYEYQEKLLKECKQVKFRDMEDKELTKQEQANKNEFQQSIETFREIEKVTEIAKPEPLKEVNGTKINAIINPQSKAEKETFYNSKKYIENAGTVVIANGKKKSSTAELSIKGINDLLPPSAAITHKFLCTYAKNGIYQFDIRRLATDRYNLDKKANITQEQYDTIKNDLEMLQATVIKINGEFINDEKTTKYSYSGNLAPLKMLEVEKAKDSISGQTLNNILMVQMTAIPYLLTLQEQTTKYLQFTDLKVWNIPRTFSYKKNGKAVRVNTNTNNAQIIKNYLIDSIDAMKKDKENAKANHTNEKMRHTILLSGIYDRLNISTDRQSRNERKRVNDIVEYCLEYFKSTQSGGIIKGYKVIGKNGSKPGTNNAPAKVEIYL